MKPLMHTRVERAIVTMLLDELATAGFKPYAVDDGGDAPVRCTTNDEVTEAVFSVDDSHILVQHETGEQRRHSVYIVLGNGLECISDWRYSEGDPDGFDKAMNHVLDLLNERELKFVADAEAAAAAEAI